jgi:hypothetical protein
MTRMSFDEYDSDLKEDEIMNQATRVSADSGIIGSAHMGFALSERDQAILGFERQWWKYSGAKEAAIRELFDMSSTRYYQLINTLIDTPEALEFDPMLVKRLRRMRSSRQAARTANRANIR